MHIYYTSRSIINQKYKRKGSIKKINISLRLIIRDWMLNKKWDEILNEELNKEYFKNIIKTIDKLYQEKEIYPSKENIFNAFKNTDFDSVKVVILGQDPYHGENEAHGLSFSVLENVKRPPSLTNIFKELESDLNIKKESTDLTSWTKEGVFLLNSLLTVEKDKPLSHKNLNWEIFTDEVIKKLNNKETPTVFILWGGYAKSKKKLITNINHLIIESAHPSPLSSYRGFFGSKPFSKTNEFLEKNNIKKVNW